MTSIGAQVSRLGAQHSTAELSWYLSFVIIKKSVYSVLGKADSKSVDAQSHSHFTKSNSSIGEYLQ